MSNKEIARKSILKFEKNILNNLKVAPNSTPYLNLCEVLKSLYFQKDYISVIGICNVVTEKVNRIR